MDPMEDLEDARQRWAAERERMKNVQDGLLCALKSFVDYYDQAGIGDCKEGEDDIEDDVFVVFDGDERFNVRQGRAAIAEAQHKKYL